ncbi:hypothetical protein Tco_0039830 [Tanacetum coccineum]
MANLKYRDEHNKVGFLEKPKGSADYLQVLDFLRSSHIRCGNAVKPLSRLFLEEFKKAIYAMGIQEQWWISSIYMENPHKNRDLGIVDSGCSRSMTGNKEKLDDFVKIVGGTVTFGGGDGKITGKGTIRTSKLNFENVYYVEELQNFNFDHLGKFEGKADEGFIVEVAAHTEKHLSQADLATSRNRVPAGKVVSAAGVTDSPTDPSTLCVQNLFILSKLQFLWSLFGTQ